jgi:hypothetical protein
MPSMGINATLAAWQEFFVVLAGVAAVLLGLVFVGESIQSGNHVRAGRHWDLAYASATSLFYALVIALALLIPEGRPIAQGVLVVVFGLLGLESSRGAFVTARSGQWSKPQLAFRFVAPLTAMIVLIVAGLVLIAGWAPGVWLTAGAAFAQITVGTQNAWDLLLGGTAPSD